MKHQRYYSCLGLACAVMAWQLALSRPAFAKEQTFDMYSWQKGESTTWCFSLLPSTKEPVDAVTAKGTKDQVCGPLDAKRLMGQMLKKNSIVYWKINETQGLALPPQDVINDLKRFSTSMDYKLKMPKGKGGQGDGWQ